MGSPLPSPEVTAQIREVQSSIDVPGLDWDWTDVAGYLDRVETVRSAVSVAVLVGHLPLRASVVGFELVRQRARKAPAASECWTCIDPFRSLLDGGSSRRRT